MNSRNRTLRTIVLASGNPGKIKEFQEFFSKLPINLKAQPEGLDIEETGLTFAENARIKSIAVAKSTGEWSLADDSGLCIEALGGAPGVFSARYAHSDSARIRRVLDELKGEKNRQAFFKSALCLASANGQILLEVEGECQGDITNFELGDEGFGYDPIFKVRSNGLTYAEMPREHKQKLGHRGIALSLLEPSLKELLIPKSNNLSA